MDGGAAPDVGGTASSRRAGAQPELHDSGGNVRVGQTVAGPLGLPLAGARVDQCCLDHAFSLTFDLSGRSWVLRIEGNFEIVQAGGATQQFGEAPPSAWGPAVDALLHQTVCDAGVAADGTLRFGFEGGYTVVVAPDIQHEAWQISGPEGELIVSGPGGGLAMWPSTSGHEPHAAETPQP